MRSGTSDVFHHEMPGGQYTNLRQQARATGLDSKWPQVVDRYAEVNQMFGDIVKVTPSSKVVGDMAIFMVSRGLTAQQVQDPDVEIDFPKALSVSSVANLEYQPAVSLKRYRSMLKGEALLGQRPGAMLPPVDLHAERNVLIETFGLDDATAPKRDARNARLDQDLSAYLLYPKVFMDYARHRRDFGDTSILPTPIFCMVQRKVKNSQSSWIRAKSYTSATWQKATPIRKAKLLFSLNSTASHGTLWCLMKRQAKT